MSRTAATRMPEMMSADRADLDALLDRTVLGHFAFTDDDGRPVALPSVIARWGDRVLTHGSTGSRWLRRIGAGVPVAVSVAAVDGIVVARSAYASSLLYGSAVLFGEFTPLAGEEKLAALDVLTDRLLPGRTAEVRRPTARELAATTMLAMPIGEWSVRLSDGWPEDPEDDVAGPAWAGLVRFGPPPATLTGAPDLRPGIAVAPSAGQARGIR
jgi:nitroimidazol reductase NimA-like FMN-containing flavoprotein (pyridoxamine 5'-phosphate oxidase superfamily)